MFFRADKVLPRYYYVPKESIEKERANPGSIERVPDSNKEVFLWGQSIYLLAKLIGEIFCFFTFYIIAKLLLNECKFLNAKC